MNLNFDDVGDTKRAQDFLQEKIAKRKTRMTDPTDTGNLDTGYTSDRPAPKAETFNTLSSEDARSFTPSMQGKGYTKPSQDKYRDNAGFDSIQRARDASSAAQETTNSTNMFKGLRQATSDTADYYRQSARRRTLGLFGDVWNVKGGPTWESPEAPSKIETDFDMDEAKDMFND